MRVDCSTSFRHKNVAFRRVPLWLRAELEFGLLQTIPRLSRVPVFEALASMPSEGRVFGVMLRLSELVRCCAEWRRKLAGWNKRTTDHIA